MTTSRLSKAIPTIVAVAGIILALIVAVQSTNVKILNDLRIEQQLIVSAIEPLLFFESQSSPVGIGSVSLEKVSSDPLCSWLSAPLIPALKKFTDVYPENGAPYFVHAYVLDSQAEGKDRTCDTAAGVEEPLPAIYVIAHLPFPSKADYTYLKISLKDGERALYFGARVIPVEDTKPREHSVVAYTLNEDSDYTSVNHAGDVLQKQWRSQRPAMQPLHAALIRLRLMPHVPGANALNRNLERRRILDHSWTITAEMSQANISRIGESHVRKNLPLQPDAIVSAAVRDAGERCIETRFDGDSSEWQASQVCRKPSKVWSVWEAIASRLVDIDVEAARLEHPAAVRALMLRIPRSVHVQRLASELGVIALLTGVVLSIGMGTWAYLRSGLRRRIAALAEAAASGGRLDRPSRQETDLLRPLELVIIRERQQTSHLEQQRAALEASHAELTEQSLQLEKQRAALEEGHVVLIEKSAALVTQANLAEEYARAYHSTANAFRHELSDFVGAAVIVLGAGPLQPSQQDNLLQCAKLAQLIIRKVANIRHKQPLKSLPGELTNSVPALVRVGHIIDWWLKLIEPSLVSRLALRADPNAMVFAAIGPVVWIMMRFSENAFRHGIGREGFCNLRIGTRRIRTGFLAITFTNRTRDFDASEIDGLFDVNRHAIKCRSLVSEEDLSGVGLYAARQYAVMTEGMVGCRYRSRLDGTGVVSFSVILKRQTDH